MKSRLNPRSGVPETAGRSVHHRNPIEFLSVVAPVHDGPEDLAALYQQIAQQAGEMARRWELIFIDYGKDSRQWLAVRNLQALANGRVRNYRLVNHRRRREALLFGKGKAHGEVVMHVEFHREDGKSTSGSPFRLTRFRPVSHRAKAEQRAWVPCDGKPNILYLPGSENRPAA